MSLRRDILLKNMGGGLPPRHMGPLGRLGNRSTRGPRDFTPIPWNDYFDRCEMVNIPEIESTFAVYFSGFDSNNDYPHTPLLVLLHGGGYSGLTWSTFVKHLREFVHVKIAAIDLRGHGNTKTNNDEDLSFETLTSDVVQIVRKLFTHEDTKVILMGHSMGGAVAVRTSIRNELMYCLAGLVVIDVVEGTALESLQGMQSFLRGRPKEFPSLENAIEWCVRSGQTKNVESARVSMPSQLTPTTGPSIKLVSNVGMHDIPEDADEETGEPSANEQPFSPPSSNFKYKFRIDLTKTEVYWRGVDRLDRELTVGQMQGKFQMQVLPQCGHAVHEDVPDKVAEIIASFLVRNQLTTAKSDDFHPTLPGC